MPNAAETAFLLNHKAVLMFPAVTKIDRDTTQCSLHELESLSLPAAQPRSLFLQLRERTGLLSTFNRLTEQDINECVGRLKAAGADDSVLEAHHNILTKPATVTRTWVLRVSKSFEQLVNAKPHDKVWKLLDLSLNPKLIDIGLAPTSYKEYRPILFAFSRLAAHPATSALWLEIEAAVPKAIQLGRPVHRVLDAFERIENLSAMLGPKGTQQAFQLLQTKVRNSEVADSQLIADHDLMHCALLGFENHSVSYPVLQRVSERVLLAQHREPRLYIPLLQKIDAVIGKIARRSEVSTAIKYDEMQAVADLISGDYGADCEILALAEALLPLLLAGCGEHGFAIQMNRLSKISADSEARERLKQFIESLPDKHALVPATISAGLRDFPIVSENFKRFCYLANQSLNEAPLPLENPRLLPATITAFINSYASTSANEHLDTVWKIFRLGAARSRHFEDIDKERLGVFGSFAVGLAWQISTHNINESPEFHISEELGARIVGSFIAVGRHLVGQEPLVTLVIETVLRKNPRPLKVLYDTAALLVDSYNPELFPERVESFLSRSLNPEKEARTFCFELGGYAALHTLLRGNHGHLEERATNLLQTSYATDSGPYGVDSPEAKRMQDQTLTVMHRGYNQVHGFTSMKYLAQRASPLDESLLMRFARSISKDVSYIPAPDNSGFPGPIFRMNGFLPERMFPADPKNEKDPFHQFKKGWPWSAKAFADLPDMRLTLAQGFVATELLQDQRCQVNGTGVTLVSFNVHQSNEMMLLVCLYPTHILNELIENQSRDKAQFFRSPRDMIAYAERCGFSVPVLSSPSNIGGLANSYPAGSAPFFEWESEMKRTHRVVVDAREHVHKAFWNEDGRYSRFIDPSLSKKFGPIRQEHERLVAMAIRHFNAYDLTRIARARFTLGRILGPRSEGQADPELKMSKNGEERGNTDVTIMLQYGYQIHASVRSGERSRENCPLIVVTNPTDDWSVPDSALYFDPWDLRLYNKETDDVIQFPLDGDGCGDAEFVLWQRHVIKNLPRGREVGLLPLDRSIFRM